ELAEEGAYLLYPPELREQLASSLSAESFAWGQRIDAMLGSFHWPAEYRQTFQSAVQHIAGHAEEYRPLFALEERLAALADVSEDAPEVEQLAEEYIDSPELTTLSAHLARLASWEQIPLSSTFIDLMGVMASPAQRRFFELLGQKMKRQS